MLVEIIEQRMDRVARRARSVVVEDQAVARVLLDQFARREMVLEIDDHAGVFLCVLRPPCSPDCAKRNPGTGPQTATPPLGFATAQPRLQLGPCPISCPMLRSR